MIDVRGTHPRTATGTKMKRKVSNALDGAERVDLLCFPVLAQLIGHATSGDWLRTTHLVEATRMWVASNSVECDWLERANLARISVAIAPQFLVFPCFRDAKEIVKLFMDGWRLDYRSPTVRGMLDVCAEHLMQQYGRPPDLQLVALTYFRGNGFFYLAR